VKVSLSEIYFWDGRWDGDVLCGKKRCGKPNFILVPIFSSQKLQKLQARETAN
jgi:hypothetical protein